MKRNKLAVFFKHYRLKIFIVSFVVATILIIAIMIYSGLGSFFLLESFSKKQLMAQIALTLLIFLTAGIIQAIIFGFINIYFVAGGGFAKLGQKRIKSAHVNVRWDDVIGMEKAKEEAWELVKLLKDREFLKAAGGRVIKGTLLLGPPGCGKTYLAKAIASEAGVPFLSAVGSEFVGTLVGHGAERMKSLFREARALAEMEGGCIIFFDEIDSFARHRVSSETGGIGAVTAHNATINQFLTEMDGLRHKDDHIAILAATNISEEQLDPAILRSGRFDRKIYVDKPNFAEREKLLMFYLTKVKTESPLELKILAEKTASFSHSDIENMIKEAGILSSRRKQSAIASEDLWQAYDKIATNLERSGRTKIIRPKDQIWLNDVLGLDEAKAQAREIIRLLKDRHFLQSVGSKSIRCTLLMGPPGCGKTFLAKAIATEAGLPFLSALGSEFTETFLERGAARMRDFFDEARTLARAEDACLVFIDEIDAFARTRSGPFGSYVHNSTLDQFLKELDDLRQSDINIIILAATNVSEEVLDPSILRAGRFDRKILLEKPKARQRKDILEAFLSKFKTEGPIDFDKMADKTLGFSVADLDNLVRESSIAARKDQRESIMTNDLISSFERINEFIQKTQEHKMANTQVNVPWEAVIGMEETKREAWEIVELLKDRNKLKVVGGKIIKGVLMIGPPGCGKTYLAKAIATEAGFPFLAAVGSDFVDKYVGEGARKLRELFREAKALAKAEGGCIVFIDEIDVFVRSRFKDQYGISGFSFTDPTINQFLYELDGLNHEEGNIVILAATNMPENALDEAVLRSGRFDRKIYFQKPSTRDRRELFKFYLSKVEVNGEIDYELLAEKAKSFSGADIHNMVREAGIFALRDNRETVTLSDLFRALERVMSSVEAMGENKILGGKVNVKWDDVIGMGDAKSEAWEVVKILKDRNLLKAIGGKIVKGVLLLGPPGCGKTYLAKAIATESGFPFLSVVGSDMVGVFIGEGARKMQEIFKEARGLAKSEGGCIVFFDEIDSFATPRYQARDFGGSMMHNAIVNQFLTELDGLRQQENNILVLAATNAKESELDPAILRAGRLERKIYIGLPNVQERKDLFKFYLNRVSFDETVDPSVLSRTTVGFSPSDIDNMVREAGLIAMRQNRDTITHKDLSESYDRLTLGAPTNTTYSKASIVKTAYHEAGHAIMTYLTHPTDEVIKATIRPRKDVLGYVYSRSLEELQTGAPDENHLLSIIKIVLAGYAAEKIVIGTTASGVSSDFQNAFQIAHNMVWTYGMGPSGMIGDFLSMHSRTGEPLISEKTKEILDKDVQDILQTCLKETIETLTKNRGALEHFAQELMTKKDLEYDEILAIFQKFGLKAAVPKDLAP